MAGPDIENELAVFLLLAGSAHARIAGDVMSLLPHHPVPLLNGDLCHLLLFGNDNFGHRSHWDVNLQRDDAWLVCPGGGNAAADGVDAGADRVEVFHDPRMDTCLSIPNTGVAVQADTCKRLIEPRTDAAEHGVVVEFIEGPVFSCQSSHNVVAPRATI